MLALTQIQVAFYVAFSPLLLVIFSRLLWRWYREQFHTRNPRRGR